MKNLLLEDEQFVFEIEEAEAMPEEYLRQLLAIDHSKNKQDLHQSTENRMPRSVFEEPEVKQEKEKGLNYV